ncbi:hypothetical protein [Domibacillus tundrae]|uniref:hypothetical protein n=1 Tax=Domibacillus tundrae TaxID=1587527 RepID=UPI000617FB41|nr:hypothetical protein [Domibacillus tundrae]
MLQGICSDPEILPTGETFFLFPAGTDYVYASRFPRKGAHTGCFEKKHFHKIKEVNETPEWQPEPPKRTVEIERNKIYSAKLISCGEHSKKLIDKTYFVIARGAGLHVDMYPSAELKGMLACYPVHWFGNFDLVDQETEIESVEIVPDSVMEEDIFDQPIEPEFFEQMKLF